jgi:hypothetical protein
MCFLRSTNRGSFFSCAQPIAACSHRFQLYPMRINILVVYPAAILQMAVESVPAKIIHAKGHMQSGPSRAWNAKFYGAAVAVTPHALPMVI